MLSHVRNGKERMPSTTISKIGELVTIDVEKVEVANLFFFCLSFYLQPFSSNHSSPSTPSQGLGEQNCGSRKKWTCGKIPSDLGK